LRTAAVKAMVLVSVISLMRALPAALASWFIDIRTKQSRKIQAGNRQ
jgi:hypothetical protein